MPTPDQLTRSLQGIADTAGLVLKIRGRNFTITGRTGTIATGIILSRGIDAVIPAVQSRAHTISELAQHIDQALEVTP